MQKPALGTVLMLVGILLMPVWDTECPAASILGEIWQNATGATNASTLPSRAPDAEFYTTSGIDYDSRLTSYTPGLYLDAPTFFNRSQTFDPNASLDNTMLRFTGLTYLNAGTNKLSIPHDDGVTLNIDGIGQVLNQPGPTSAVTTDFDVTAPSAGLYHFTLQYGECAGPPAVLKFAVNTVVVGVPEPNSALLLAVGGLAWLAVRRRSRSTGEGLRTGESQRHSPVSSVIAGSGGLGDSSIRP